MKVPHRRFGWLLLVAALLFAGVMIGLAAQPTSYAQDNSTPQPDELGSDFYGINFIFPRQPWLTIGYNSGARVVRWQFNWRDAEPSPGAWSWDVTDDEIAAWNRAGLEIHAILHNPPDFAKSSPDSLVPNNLDASWSSTTSSFSRYCNQFAARYQGRVASYEVWNEPDLREFWTGTADQYYTLLKGCYQAIKAADPLAPVAMGGMAYIVHKDFSSQVIAAAARDPDGAAHNHFFDVMALHAYADPELIYTNTQAIRDTLSAYGLGDKPIWITETNVGLRGVNGIPDVPKHGLATPEEASWYVLQAASNAIAAGAEKLMFFRLTDADMLNEAWGLVSNDATPRPAYRALQLAASVMQDIREAKREVINSDVVVTDMRRGDGARIVTAYSRRGQAASITVPAQTSVAVLINAAGGYSPIEADANSNYTIDIPAAAGRDFNRASSYTVGGPVMVLVEFDRDPPVTTVTTVKVPTNKLFIGVHWQGDDGRFGTGVAKYDVEVSDNGGPWKPWLTGTTESEGMYDMSKGGTFAFRARATDRAGNIGEFSSPAVATLKYAGTLSGRIENLRGQAVPSARVTLGDGSLHDAGSDGWVHIELPLGMAQVTHIDGGVQGQAGEQPQVEIALAEDTIQTWQIAPQNLIANGDFNDGLQGWDISSPSDVRMDAGEQGAAHNTLHLDGQRRPWGTPAAGITLKIPADYAAAVLSFRFRLLERGYVLRLRAISEGEQAILWQTDGLMNQPARVWTDISRYAGKEIGLRFELWGPKGSADGRAEIAEVFVGNVPSLP